MIRYVRSKDLLEVATLYAACFREPPWQEHFEIQELVEEFNDMMAWENTIFLLDEEVGRMSGATIGFPIQRKDDLICLIPTEFQNAYYIAEVFVDRNSRGQHIATKLVRESLKLARDNGSARGIVRTSVSQPIIKHMFQNHFDWRILVFQDVTSVKVIDGKQVQASDSRIILGGRL